MPSANAIRIVRQAQPDLARQAQALLRLLGDLRPETAQPQAGEPGAVDHATVGSGCDMTGRHDYDLTTTL